MTRARRIALSVWLTLTVGLGVVYALYPELIDPTRLVDRLRLQASPFIVGSYVLLSLFRPLTLVPSTVLIVVGTILFPDDYIVVFVISLSGIVASAGLIYYFFDFLGLADIFEQKHSRRIRWLEEKLSQHGFWIVVGWSVFPFVPTDVICYVAGSLRMHLGKFLLAVAIGEIPIVIFYIGGSLWLFGL